MEIVVALGALAVVIRVLMIRRKRRSAAANKVPAAAELGEAYLDTEPGVNEHLEKKGPGGPTEPIELTTT